MTLETKDLIFQTLQIQMDQKETRQETEAQQEENQEKQQKLKMKAKLRGIFLWECMLIKMVEVPKKNHDGFKHLKDQLEQSNNRIEYVRFGVPFGETIQASHDRKQGWEEKDEEQVQTEEGSINWNSLKFDEDRKTYYGALYNKSEKGIATNLTIAPIEECKPLHVSKKQNEPSSKPSSRPGTTRSVKMLAPKVSLSSKQIEKALGIKKTGNTVETTDKVFKMIALISQ